MTGGRRFCGVVRWPPGPSSAYVRVAVHREGELPLSVKASFSPSSLRHCLVSGTRVELRRTSVVDARRYEVVRLLRDTATDSERETTMTTYGNSCKDRVTFFLPPRYFTKHATPNGMRLETCVKVLAMAFKHPSWPGSSWGSIMQMHPQGFHITCRPDQFARFIVHRYEANECINGIRDLEPRLVPKQKDQSLYEDVAEGFLDRASKELVYEILARAEVEDRRLRPDPTWGHLDVSDNR